MIRASRHPSVRPVLKRRGAIALAASLALAALAAAGPAGAQAPSLPRITSGSPLPSGTVSGAYSGSFAASGGTAPYSFSAFGTPAGLSLSAGGALGGTPTLEGTSTFVVSVRDVAALGDIGGPTFLDAAGNRVGPPTGWSSPRTDFAYRFTGTAVGKNNHNLPSGPPAGDPTGSLDPNLAGISWFRSVAGGIVTIDGSFPTPITSSNFSLDASQFLGVGLINQSWVNFALSSDGYTSRMFSTPSTGSDGNAYLLVYRLGSSLQTSMEDHEAGNQTATDKRSVASIGSFSIQFQAGVDRNGSPVADLVPHKKKRVITPHPVLSKIEILYNPIEDATEQEWPKAFR